jgi:hypothetical protein
VGKVRKTILNLFSVEVLCGNAQLNYWLMPLFVAMFSAINGLSCFGDGVQECDASKASHSFFAGPIYILLTGGQ